MGMPTCDVASAACSLRRGWRTRPGDGRLRMHLRTSAPAPAWTFKSMCPAC